MHGFQLKIYRKDLTLSIFIKYIYLKHMVQVILFHTKYLVNLFMVSQIVFAQKPICA